MEKEPRDERELLKGTFAISYKANDGDMTEQLLNVAHVAEQMVLHKAVCSGSIAMYAVYSRCNYMLLNSKGQSINIINNGS